ncbi:hypothetical protein R1flu_004842 [Riccia fluitans]|uniref:DUF4005 domain-containing protein n=1 Tax=Riccia fluitans TaxID=41844 RepID=A0ABD1YRG1_9MARC
MAKKGKWFSAMKKAFRSPPKDVDKNSATTAGSTEQQQQEDTENNEQAAIGHCKKPHKEKRSWSFSKLSTQVYIPGEGKEDQGPNEICGNEEQQNQRAIALAAATSAAADAAVAAAEAAAAVVRLTSGRHHVNSEEYREEWAAIRIQTAFRGYLARRALRALRGLVRLQALVRGHTVRRQATITLRCMQALVRVQARVRARRVRMSEEGQAVQRQINSLTHHHNNHKPRKSISDSMYANEENGWNDSVRSAEELQQKEQNRQEAALKRERALAYACSHQLWRGKDKSQYFIDCDPDKPNWGWTWLERWMAARPWENRLIDPKDPMEEASAHSTDAESAKIVEIDYARHNFHNRNSGRHQQPLRPESIRMSGLSPGETDHHHHHPQRRERPQAVYGPLNPGVTLHRHHHSDHMYDIPTPAVEKNLHPLAPLGKSCSMKNTPISSYRSGSPRRAPPPRRDDEDLSVASTTNRSTGSVNSGKRFGTRNNLANNSGSIRDDESMASSPAVPNYMQITQSARLKSRSHSTPKQRPGMPEKVSSQSLNQPPGATAKAQKVATFHSARSPSLRAPPVPVNHIDRLTIPQSREYYFGNPSLSLNGSLGESRKSYCR